MNIRKKRLAYLFAALLLLGIEVLIALFVHDKIVRPYIGDVLVVIVIYTFVRVVVPEKVSVLPLFIFLFAIGVEALQAIHIVELLGLSENRFFRILIGSTFDLKDIVCYAAGCAVLGGYEILRRKRGI